MKKKNKNNAFKTPEGYFDSLTDKLLAHLEEEKNLLPTTNSDKEKDFAVPEGYFDKLDKEILQKVEKQETKVVRLRSYRKYYLAAASVAAIVLVIVGFQWNSKAQDLSFDDLDNTDIENYLENIDLGLSSYEIAEVLSVDELEINDILENKLNEDNIIDYLDENVDDFDELNFDNDE